MANNLNEFLTLFGDFAEHINMPELSFDNNGDASFAFADDVEVHLHLDNASGTLFIYGEVADLEGIEDQTLILTRLLQGNMFWMATRGFTLSMDEKSQRIVLAGKQGLNYFGDAEFFEEYICTFADVIRDWKQLIEDNSLEELPSDMLNMQELLAEKNETDEEACLEFRSKLQNGKFWI